MRGSPPIHLALLLVGFVLLAIPLVRLTSDVRVVAKDTKDGKDSYKLMTTIRFRYAHKPTKMGVTLGNEQVLSDAANPLMEIRQAMPIPKEGIELQVDATWPAGTPDTALTIEMEPDGLEAQSQTRWSREARMNEIIVYQWKP